MATLINYVRQKLPDPLFAVVRMEWQQDDGVSCVDEVRLHEGIDSVDGFVDLMQTVTKGGAEVSIICPYDPEHLGLRR